MDEKMKLHEKGKFFFHYFNRSWSVFRSTLLEACSEAQERYLKDKEVKLYKINTLNTRDEIDFLKVIKEIRLTGGDALCSKK